jgi:hypothetical protein
MGVMMPGWIAERFVRAVQGKTLVERALALDAAQGSEIAEAARAAGMSAVSTR